MAMNKLPLGPSSDLIATIGIMRDPFGALVRCVNKYGDPFTITSSMQGSIVVTGDLAGIRSIFGADPDIYAPSGANVMGPVLGPGCYDPMWLACCATGRETIAQTLRACRT